MAAYELHCKVTNVITAPSGKISQIVLQPVNDASVSSPAYTYTTPQGSLVIDCSEANQNTPAGAPTNFFVFNAATVALLTVGSDVYLDISSVLI